MSNEEKLYKFLFTKVNSSEDKIIKEFQETIKHKYVEYVQMFTQNKMDVSKEDIDTFQIYMRFINQNIKHISADSVIEFMIINSLVYLHFESNLIKKDILMLLVRVLYNHRNNLDAFHLKLMLISLNGIEIPVYLMEDPEIKKYFKTIVKDINNQDESGLLEEKITDNIEEAIKLSDLIEHGIDDKNVYNIRHKKIYKLKQEQIIDVNNQVMKYYNKKYLLNALEKDINNYIENKDVEQIVNNIKSLNDIQSIIILMKNGYIKGPGFELLFMNLLPIITHYGNELDDNFISFFIESYIQDLADDFTINIDNKILFKTFTMVLKQRSTEHGNFLYNPKTNRNFIYLDTLFIDNIRQGHYSSLIGTIHHEITHARQDLREINGVVSYNDIVILMEQILRHNTSSNFYDNNYDNLKLEMEADYYGMSARNDYEREFYNLKLDDIYQENDENKKIYSSDFNKLEDVNVFEIFSSYIYDHSELLNQYPQLKIIYKKSKGKVILKSIEEIDKIIDSINNQQIDFNKTYPTCMNGKLEFKPFNQKALLHCHVSKTQFMKLLERVKQLQTKEKYHK